MSHGPLEDTCPSEDDVAAFLRGCLASHGGRALEAHVARCAACRRLLSALAQAGAGESRPTSDSVSPTLRLDTGAETELAIKERIGRYVVLDWLGAGGMGVVYAAYDPELSRKVALKVLRYEDAGRSDRAPIRDLLLREAQAMAQLAHPNVVAVFDVGSVQDRVFIAMELVDGMTLAQWLATKHRTRSEIMETFLAAGNGLMAAHAAGLIHRDFKPDNVLVGHHGRVRVTDFGLARLAPPEPVGTTLRRAAAPAGEPSAPQSGLAGTLAYMAPEQYLGQPADARADQFSFAVALYEALYGERPFAPLQLADPDLAERSRVPAAPHGRGVPSALRQVLLRGLSPAPHERYPSMLELLAALAPKPRRRRRIAAGALLLTVTAVASAAAYAIHLRHAAEQRTELVGRLRGIAPEMRTLLRSAHMLPRHDIRAAREGVRSAMHDVERQQQRGEEDDELALVNFVLGEGHRALGDDERALPLLEAAWQAGERGPHIDAALGAALGATYEHRLSEVELLVQSSRREVQLRHLEERYRDPALAHLRTALAAGDGSPTYLEALIAFHAHHFVESGRLAHAAFTSSPTLYEAGVLEAKVHNEAGRELLAADRSSEANTEFAEARRIFERVLEIARSDDDAWLAYGEMVYAQAHALAGGDLPAELRKEAISALHTVREINPDRWEAVLREAQIYEQEANIAIIWYRDPGPYVDQVLTLADQARVHHADPDQVDVLVCLAHWTRAVYQGGHALDPHSAFQQAIVACQRAAAAKPDVDKYAALGAVYSSLASYEAEHGADPMHTIELSERNLRAAIGIEDGAVLHHNLGRLWTNVANYQEGHGRDPQRAVDRALAEFTTAVQMDATRADAWAGMSDALIARARFQQAAQADPQPTETQARALLERALAVEPALVPPIRHRIRLAELDAEALLAHHADPSPVVAHMRADAQLLLSRLPNDGFAHRFLCWAALISTRWALAHHAAVDHALARAAAEATRARECDAMSALAWTASAEVEALRAEIARARGLPSRVAVATGLGYIDQALKIDPDLVRTLKVRDQLARSAGQR
jgi:tetratricopeptide (TPR) repeat protein/predicted Ser/Thr protein kinase